MSRTWAAVEQHLHRRQAIVTSELTWACVRAVWRVCEGRGGETITLPNQTVLSAQEIVEVFKLDEIVEAFK